MFRAPPAHKSGTAAQFQILFDDAAWSVADEARLLDMLFVIEAMARWRKLEGAEQE